MVSERGRAAPGAGGDLAEIRRVVATVVDPEIPVLTIDDLGVLRDVSVDEDGTVVVTITPTYSGCPAMQLIEDQIAITLELAGVGDFRVETVYSPAWTTDWMTEEAREKLRTVGIAPPPEGGGIDPGRPAPPVGGSQRPADRRVGASPQAESIGAVLCPRCDSHHTRTVSEFGSTACKALMVCGRCGEPFDLFKRL